MKILNITLTILLASSMIACGYSKAVTPPEDKGFVTRRAENAAGIISEKTPFMYFWSNPTWESKHVEHYRTQKSFALYVAPVGTKYLDMSDKGEDLKKTVSEIATYLTEQLKKESSEYDKGYYTVNLVDNRDTADAILELELTEVGFGNPLLYAGAWALPLPGTSTAYDAMHTSVLSFEGRILEGSSGEIAYEMFDRKIPKIRIVDLNKALSKSSPLRDISNDWAQEFAWALAARSDQDKIEGKSYFSLVPW